MKGPPAACRPTKNQKADRRRPPAAHPCLDGGWRAGGPQGRPATQRLTPALRFGGRAAVGRRVAGLSSL